MRRIETQRGKPRDRDERNQNNQKIIKSSTRRESKAATSTKQKPLGANIWCWWLSFRRIEKKGKRGKRSKERGKKKGGGRGKEGRV
jgi:hypothetical protein